MNPDDLARILDELANRLGPGGEYVFGLAVRQAAIEGWTSLSLLVGGVVAFGAGALRFDWSTEEVTPSFLAAAVGFLVAFGGALVFFTGGITKLLNPEYAALTDILSRIVP